MILEDLQQTFRQMINRQQSRPTGIVGHVIGNRMLQQHRSENLWAVSLLDVRSSDQILEVGFGSGFALRQIATRLTTGCVTGIDLSHTMVAQARLRNVKAVRAGRVNVCQGDVMRLPFPEAVFDKVLSIHSAYFWPDPVHALSEVARVLKPTGTFVQIVLLRNDLPPDSLDGYTEKKVSMLMQQAGFSSIRTEHAPDRLGRMLTCLIGTKSATNSAAP